MYNGFDFGSIMGVSDLGSAWMVLPACSDFDNAKLLKEGHEDTSIIEHVDEALSHFISLLSGESI